MVALRKMATEERMGKRRASLKSLESDFEKVKHFIQRVKPAASASSINDSIETDDDDRDNKLNKYDLPDGLESIDSHDNANKSIIKRDKSNEGGVMFVIKRERPLSSIY